MLDEACRSRRFQMVRKFVNGGFQEDTSAADITKVPNEFAGCCSSG